ncbi:MAG TPA: AAA family ATPase [Solirubrobacteraceae bacterium]|jgi:tetratricopeptide (TPR) repeat protein
MPATEAPLVGRAADLALIDELIDGLQSGRPRALSIVGGAGIGKTRLLSELTSRADACGHLVLGGSASELEQDLPFGAFVDALDEYTETVDPQRFARVDDAVRAELARVLPSFAGDGDAAVTAGVLQDERYRSHRAIRTLLEALATKPLVLMLDDFHWADPASLELAGALLRRPPNARVMLVLAARPRQHHQLFSAELARAEREGALVHRTLEPLSLADTRTLLGDAVSAAGAETVYEDSGGVPFYAEQLARTDVDGRTAVDDARDRPEADGAVPPAVAASLRVELAQLDRAVRRVLEGAAVAGDPFEPELAAAAADVTEGDAVDAIDELLRIEFLRSTDVPSRFRFRHPLVRRAVYEAAPAGWRLGAHERVGSALTARGGALAVRAHHAERSARQGDAGSVTLLRAAGDQAAARAPASAARWYASALRLLSDAAPDEERIRLLLERAKALAALGRLGESHAVLEDCLAVTPDSTELTLETARVERLLGRQQAATARLERVLSHAGAVTPEAVALNIELAIDGFYRVDLTDMQHRADGAVAEADALGDPALRAAAYAIRVLAGAWRGDVAGAEAALPAAVAIIDGLDDATLAARPDAVVNLAAAELYSDRFADSARHAERALAMARATGHGEHLPTLHACLSTSWTMRGRLKEAAHLLDGALEAARLRDDEQGLAWMLFNRALVALTEGDLDTALATSRESHELAQRIEGGLISGWAGFWYGSALAASGEAARGIEVIIDACGGEELPLIPGGWRVTCLDGLLRARIEAGRLDDARRSARLAQDHAAQMPLPLARAMGQLAGARMALADGDAAAAVEPALAAAEACRSVGALSPAAAAEALAGRALGESGRTRARGVAPAGGRDGSGGVRRVAPARRRRPGASPARVPGATAATRAARRRHRHRSADRARTGDRRSHRRAAHQQGDRRPALPEREDDRDPHAQRVREARGHLARAGGAGDGVGRPDRLARLSGPLSPAGSIGPGPSG